MLYQPARSPLSASSRLPGGTRRKSSVAAASNCASFRRATRSNRTKRRKRYPAASCSVSLHRKLRITRRSYRISIRDQTPIAWSRTELHNGLSANLDYRPLRAYPQRRSAGGEWILYATVGRNRERQNRRMWPCSVPNRAHQRRPVTCPGGAWRGNATGRDKPVPYDGTTRRSRVIGMLSALNVLRCLMSMQSTDR